MPPVGPKSRLFGNPRRLALPSGGRRRFRSGSGRSYTADVAIGGKATGPFRPGDGGLPPYLAGRQREQSRFRELLGDLAHRRAPPSEVVLYGPRGNGKTALLAWFRQEAAKTGAAEAFQILTSEIGGSAALDRRLRSNSRWRSLVPESFSVFGAAWRRAPAGPTPLARTIAARARRKPLALLVDEAHTLDPAAGRELLQASQAVGRELPFLLVLAGTPDLPAHLSAMGASFWGRAEKMPLGRLDADSTAAAIGRPLASEDIRITEEALAAIVGESHGYPYFIQLWGDAVWRQARAAPPGERVVGRAEVEAAATAFHRARGLYYLIRYEELEKRRLLPVARAVARAFAAKSRLSGAELETAIGRGLGAGAGFEAASDAQQSLRHLGYIWRAGTTPDWEPGIPSLMDYVLESTGAGSGGAETPGALPPRR